jgi:hypothetical protein
MRRVILGALIGVMAASSVACTGMPFGTPARTTNRPASARVASAGETQTQARAAADTAATDETTSVAESTSAAAAEPLSESAYKDAVRPLMRRLGENGRESTRVPERAQSRSAADARSRAVELKAQVAEIEAELGGLVPPQSLQRGHDRLVDSIARQKEFLDAQIEAYDKWSDRNAAGRALQQASDHGARAMSYYGEAASALGIYP